MEPLLPAFHILWSAAVRGHTIDKPINQGRQVPCIKSPARHLTDGHHNGQRDLKDNQQQTSCQKSLRLTSACDETVVVCTLDCDNGDRFIRHVIHESPSHTEWLRAEDHFVDWLNSEQASHQVQKVDVTVYFCYLPQDTTADGIRRWLKKLKAEGKDINATIKVACLSNVVYGSDDVIKGSTCQYNDVMTALRRLKSQHVQIEAITSNDWARLIDLLTDHNTLHAMDKSQSHAAQILNSLLQADYQ